VATEQVSVDPLPGAAAARREGVRVGFDPDDDRVAGIPDLLFEDVAFLGLGIGVAEPDPLVWNFGCLPGASFDSVVSTPRGAEFSIQPCQPTQAHPQHQQPKSRDCEQTAHGQQKRFEVLAHSPPPCVVPAPLQFSR
jgi:hypothetical protein